MQKKSGKKAMGSGSGIAKKTRGGSASAPIKARTIGKSSKIDIELEKEEITNVFNIDMDSVECDICCMPFESQVYTCKNGHVACGNCCISMNRKCSCCNESIGDFRCRATEKILAGMTRPCKFKKHGCQETVRFTEMRIHEEAACRYAPYRCPFDGCPYSGLGLQLYGHILDDHTPTSHIGLLRRTTVTLEKAAPFRALLHRDGESVFLLLNSGDVLTGRSLSMVCICPYPTEDNMEVRYTMEVKGDDPGMLSLTASGTVQFVRRLEGFKAKGFLFVPDDFWGASGSVTVTVQV